MTWTLITRTGSWGHYVSSAPGTDMATLKPGDWKVMSDQAYIRKDNIGTIAGINPNIDAVSPKPGTAGAYPVVVTTPVGASKQHQYPVQ